MSTPNMGLVLPVVSSTPGPLYASENNQAFSVIDAHDHSPGNGVPIPTAGISINGDLPLNSYNLSLIRSSQYDNQSSALVLPTDIRSVYVVGGDLYYNNGIGQAIQITAGAALNATTIGGIGGDYATSTASEFYTSMLSTFTFWAAPNIPAAIDSGPLTLRTITASPFGITINSPLTLSADYSLTLFNSLPASTKILTVDNAGNIGAVYDVDNSTLEVSSNTLRVKAAGITNTQIASNTILNGNVADNTLGIVKLQSNLRTITTFTSSGTYTVPDDVTYVRVIACGGGGGGGGGKGPGTQGGGGGGAGAAVFEGILAVTPGGTYNITIGTGGAGGGLNADGAGGGATIIDDGMNNLIICYGGNGGIHGTGGIGGIGGVAGKGTHLGAPGSDGVNIPSGGGNPGAGYLLGIGTVGGNGGQGSSTTGGGGGGSVGPGGLGGDARALPADPGVLGGGGGGGRDVFNGANGGDGYVAIYVL